MFIRNRLKSIGFACSGIIQFFITETHAKIHAVSAIMAVCLSYYLGITVMEWLLIILAIGMVIISEMINTAIEKLVDMVSPDFNKNAEFIKDVAAGAVLVAAIIALLIGGIVFIKYL